MKPRFIIKKDRLSKTIDNKIKEVSMVIFDCLFNISLSIIVMIILIGVILILVYEKFYNYVLKKFKS